jgi:MFS family permease
MSNRRSHGGVGWARGGRRRPQRVAVLPGLRFVLGVAHSPTFPAAAQGVARWIPPIRQGLADGIVMAAICGGSAIAPTLLFRAMVRSSILSVEGPFWATMMEVAAARSGTGGGVMNCGANIGVMISPLFTPVTAAYMGWKNALYVAAALAFVGAALCWVFRPACQAARTPRKFEKLCQHHDNQRAHTTVTNFVSGANRPKPSGVN